MNFTVIIPARFGATRLPGKPLLDIAGKPMIQHVYERALESGAGNIIIGIGEIAKEVFGDKSNASSNKASVPSSKKGGA